MNKSIANYHTHTVRCKHAVGSEREYIENAIAAGMEVLGFSDHVPQPYQGDIISGIRMDMSELEGYFLTLEKLRAEYKGQIDIKIGFEAEYLPTLFPKLVEILGEYPCDYLLLGQHFLDRETGENYAGRETTEEKPLARYVDLVLEALSTEKFAYVAHPDLLHFVGKEEIYRKHMERLCRGAKERNIPLEINLLGANDGRHYPNPLFWKLAGEMGNQVVIGFDAHNPKSLLNKELYQRMKTWAEGLGVAINEEYRIETGKRM